MPDAVIVAACRTAIGTSFKGSLTETSAFDLAEPVITEVLHRSTLDPALLDDIVFGEVMQGGGDIARHVAVRAGLTSVPGLALNRQCASSLSAIQTAAAGIRAGMDRAVLAGGAESPSTAPVLRRRIPGTQDWQDRWMSPSHPATAEAPSDDMSITVGWNTAKLAGVSREEMDAWALRSHQRAVAAIDGGRFAEEIVPIKVRNAEGAEILFDTDEHPRRDTSMERLGRLKPLHPEIEGFSITAGNSSGVNDAAAAVLLTSAELAAQQGLRPLGVVRSWASVGVDPVRTGLAPTEAIPKALERAGLKLSDVTLFEINEAFASMCVASTRILGIDPELVNISGSGCSLGHPIAATGARMVTTLLGDLRRRGGGIGVASLCAGGGMGSALVVEAFRP
ncbi:thiolase family protein [Amycolatopsis acidiphila]|uniref:acetyl-CoA C-acyltransferase n=1 Tax=Amycolatopsis acidiphila TaxID=715473 RepID=A0A558AP22_9PSEU|nr:thiolase family protein [Amycolatopsis acidiphila]TVT26005.1 thiolase family protein [Amycolatopsis acidiphila]UIJ63281.1 thiolase family protein [Amycolatopsis acidiphila]GHG74759.1 acetyl-CoA acetyltransferase [Amycolatopsis acidiphila]